MKREESFRKYKDSQLSHWSVATALLFNLPLSISVRIKINRIMENFYVFPKALTHYKHERLISVTVILKRNQKRNCLYNRRYKFTDGANRSKVWSKILRKGIKNCLKETIWHPWNTLNCFGIMRWQKFVRLYATFSLRVSRACFFSLRHSKRIKLLSSKSMGDSR